MRRAGLAKLREGERGKRKILGAGGVKALGIEAGLTVGGIRGKTGTAVSANIGLVAGVRSHVAVQTHFVDKALAAYVAGSSLV